MHRPLAALILALVFSALLVGCSPTPDPPAEPPATGSQDPSAPPSDSPAAGLRLAPGLYELEDGTAQAVGTLEYRDLEGGFWAVIGGTAAEGNEGEVVAVIANGSEFQDELKQLEGDQVTVTGRKLDGASIRMAGPEIEMVSVEGMSDTPGIAE